MGGGIAFVGVNTTASISNTNITNNFSNLTGGGVAISPNAQIENTGTRVLRDLFITNSSFIGNAALERSGALDIQQVDGEVLLQGLVFEDNSAEHGQAGAVRLIQLCFPRLEHIIFRNNSCLLYGGALFVDNVADNTNCHSQSQIMSTNGNKQENVITIAEDPERRYSRYVQDTSYTG